MLDERRKTKDERKNVIASHTCSERQRGSLVKRSVITLFVAAFFSACSDYVSQMEEDFEEWKKTHSEVDSDESSSSVTEFSSERVSSSSVKSNGPDTGYDCSVSDGVKVVYPAGGEKFKVGQTIDVVFGTDLDDNGYRVVFKKNSSDVGMDLTDGSVGPSGRGDGKTCYTVKVKLSSDRVDATSNGIIRVVPYNKNNKGASSKEFVVEKELNEESSSSSIESSSSVKGTSSSAVVSSSSVSSSSIITLASGAVVQKDVSLYWDDYSESYDIVTIGSQTWMAENLYSQYMSPYCFQNRTDYCEMYGRLYTFSLTEDACPDGWHVPDTTDWKILLEVVGDKSAKKLKSEQWAGSDEFGFGVLPAGSGNISENWKQSYDATESCFWTSSETDGENVAVLCFSSDENEAKWQKRSKTSLYSIRCIKGEKKTVAKSSSSSVQSSSSFSVSKLSATILGDSYSVVDFNAEEGNMNLHQKWMAENLQYWDDSFTSTEKTCFDDYYAYDYDNGVDFCEKYGRYYNAEEALFIHRLSTNPNDCWVLPDSQEVKGLIGIVGKDVKKLYSEKMGGDNESKFNLLPAGYYDREAVFLSLTGNKKLKTCFWIRLDSPSNPSKLAAYCFYEDGKAAVEMTDEVRKARLPIRLIYDRNFCLTH